MFSCFFDGGVRLAAPIRATFTIARLASIRSMSAPPLESTSDLLTPRQLEVLELMAKGLTNKEIGGVRGIAPGGSWGRKGPKRDAGPSGRLRVPRWRPPPSTTSCAAARRRRRHAAHRRVRCRAPRSVQRLFPFEVGESVEFSIGGIVLGTVPARAIVSPIDLVAGAVDATAPGVTNRARFLQMLDEDQNLANGIRITEAVRNAAAGLTLDFDQAIAAFESSAAVTTVLNTLNTALGGPRSLPGISAAQNHLTNTLSTLEDAYGVLAVAGPDVANFSPTFVPTIGASATNAGSRAISWTETFVNAPHIRTTGLTINTIDGDVVNVIFNVVTISPNGSYAYLLNCLSRPSRCSGVDVEPGAGRVDFDDVRLSPTPGGGVNLASDDVSINGRIEIGPAVWPEGLVLVSPRPDYSPPKISCNAAFAVGGIVSSR